MNADVNTTSAWRFPHTPDAPAWELAWDALCQRFAWLRELEGAIQDPAYHAEGDVLTHTRMVAEALRASPAWRALPAQERALQFAAALLHDIAKPQCTVVESDGHISSRGHGRKGESRVRQLLWLGEELDPPPLPLRERVAKLVRFHGLPLWFLEQADPQRAVITASQVVPLDRLALLAEVDARGRICQDLPRLLQTIELFREFAAELGCLATPYAFAGEHSRFLYFRRPHLRPDYQAYDDTRFEVVLMCGLPAAGKDTWVARNLPGWPAITLDAIRRELRIAPTDNQGPVLDLAQERARGYLRRQQPFVWNATSITLSRRRQLVDLFSSYGARVRIVYLDAPLDELLRRNAGREAAVPAPVIRAMMARLDVPDPTEAHVVEWHYAEFSAQL